MSELPISSEMTGEPHADSIEIELTAEDLAPRPATGTPVPRRAETRSNVQIQIRRATGALTTAFAFILLRSIAQYEGLTASPPPPRAAASNPQPSPPQLVYEKPQQVSSPIRVANPFDASEVFEFPPGTSKAEARESVANLLMQRARDRRPQWGAGKRKARQQLPGDTSDS